LGFILASPDSGNICECRKGNLFPAIQRTKIHLEEHTMNNYFRNSVIGFLVALPLLVACGSQPAAPTVTRALSSPASSVAARGTVPEPLHIIEGLAEDIIDRAPANEWDKISEDVTKLAEAWQSYQPQATADAPPSAVQQALSDALAQLQTASANKDAASTMQTANDVSAAVIDLFDFYKPAMPADIGRLDVLERQVVLDVAANNFTAASNSLSQTKTVWKRLKPVIIEHNGSDVATQFETSLATQQDALNNKNASTLTAEANNGLELVDALEKLF
jgi:hypothetical protein